MAGVFLKDLGIIEYGEAWQKQDVLMQHNLQVKSGWYKAGSYERPAISETRNYLLLCEHPHVYTLGKSGHMEHLLLNDTRLKELNISFYKTSRGGDITYHGPGQVVGYPILDLELFFTDLGRYMRCLEEVIIEVLAYYGIRGERLPGATGVWLDPDTPKARKICAMGVRCSRWVTMHGFALNVNTDLKYFDYIVPCGISDKSVTSMQKELGTIIVESEVKTLLLTAFAKIFGAEIIPMPAEDLEKIAATHLGHEKEGHYL